MFLVDPNIVLITETWCKPLMADHFLNVNNQVFYRTDRRHRIRSGTIIYIRSDIWECKVSNECVDAVDDSTCYTVNCGFQNYLLVGCIYRPHHADTIFDKLLTNVLFVASYQPYTFKTIEGDSNVPKTAWSSTSVPGQYNKLF